MARPIDDRNGRTSHMFKDIAKAAIPKTSGVNGYPHARYGLAKSGSVLRRRISATAVNAKKIQIANIAKEYNSWYVPVSTRRVDTLP